MKAIQDATGFLFIGIVALFSAIAVMGIWEILGKDVIEKSLMTIGLLALVAVIVMVAGRFVGNRESTPGATIVVPHPAFHSIRRLMIGVLIASVSLLALLGVMSIWDVIDEREVLFKSLSSIAVLAFAAFVVVITCLEREGTSAGSRKVTLGGFLAALIAMWVFASLFGTLMRF
jgi:hypothetical protein